MKGTIDHIKRWKGGYFFIKGDDGIRYFSHRKFVTNADDHILYADEWLTMWNACAFVGARVDFEPAEEKDGDSPIASNVVLEKAADPDLDNRLLTRKTNKENRERKEQNRKREENKQLSKKLAEANQGYVIQQRVGETWANVYKEDKLLWAKDVETAKQMIDEMREYGDRYRLTKVQLVKNYTTGEMIPRPVR